MKDAFTLSKTKTTAVAKLKAAGKGMERLFALNQITLNDINDLDNAKRRRLGDTCTKILERLKGEERDKFLEQIDLIMPPATKTQIWEHNHITITEAVSRLIRERGIMPTKNHIAEETGLSRQTIAKHLNEYKRHPEFTAQMEQFKFMAPNLLARVFKVALSGDMKAARLYLETIGSVNKRRQTGGVVNEQNNYIQINNTILSQENLERLSADQLTEIENLLNTQYKIV